MAGTTREVGLGWQYHLMVADLATNCCWEEATQCHDRLSLPSPLCVMLDSPASCSGWGPQLVITQCLHQFAH